MNELSERLTSEPHANDPPAAGSPGKQRLAPRALSYLNVQHALVVVVIGCAGAGAIAFVPDSSLRGILWALTGVLVTSSLSIELPWLNRVHVRTTSYSVTGAYVYIARGRLWRRSVVIATPQILNVEISQGPLLRAFGLVSVRLLSIVELEHLGPLERDAAERIRSTVLASQLGGPDE
ncbi:MAG: PH domain-containing protein [Microbacterium sp.]